MKSKTWILSAEPTGEVDNIKVFDWKMNYKLLLPDHFFLHSYLPLNYATWCFVALDKLSTLCPNSIQFHYIPLQFSIKFEQECNNNFIIALLLGLQCNNNLLLHSCSNFIQNQCLINETNTTLPTVPTLKIFWLSIKSCIARFYLSKSETIFE